jgi:transaldolase
MSFSQVIRIRQPCLWLDGFERNLINSGRLQQLVAAGRVEGILTNFVNLEQSLHGTAYDQDIRLMQNQLDAGLLYEYIQIRDMQLAADLLKGIHDRTEHHAGYAILDLSPPVWQNAEAALREAQRLWQAIGWSNLMLSIPAIPTMLPVIEQLISEGLSVNVTFLVSQNTYEQVASAYLRGLENLASHGGELRNVLSLISFPIADLDRALEAQLSVLQNTFNHPQNQATLASLSGRIAIAQARLIYQHYQQLYQSHRWQTLANAGAHKQRLLWTIDEHQASESQLRLYIDALSHEDTAIALAPHLIEQWIKPHSRAAKLTQEIDIVQQTIETAEAAGLSMNAIVDQVVDESMRTLQTSFDRLLAAIEARRQSIQFLNGQPPGLT